MLVVAPLLLVAVTEAIRANGEVFEGLYVFLLLSLIALRSLYSDCVFSTGFVGCVVMVYMCDANRLY